MAAEGTAGWHRHAEQQLALQRCHFPGAALDPAGSSWSAFSAAARVALAGLCLRGIVRPWRLVGSIDRPASSHAERTSQSKTDQDAHAGRPRAAAEEHCCKVSRPRQAPSASRLCKALFVDENPGFARAFRHSCDAALGIKKVYCGLFLIYRSLPSRSSAVSCSRSVSAICH